MEKSNRDTKESTKLSKSAIIFANIVFFAGFFISCLLLIDSLYQLFSPNINEHFSLLKPLSALFIATLFAMGFRLNKNVKVNLSVLLFTIFVTLCIVETYLELSFPAQIELAKKYAKKEGVPFDSRTQLQVINDLSKKGPKAYPTFSPCLIEDTSGLLSQQGKVFPLGGLSNVITVVHHNESGYFPVFTSDEYGFNNPKGLYKKGNVDIMLIGDSFAEGYAVHADETIAADLRKSGYHAISLGKGGNGPYFEYATLKEYAKPFEPKIVLWLYYTNDLDNIKVNRNSLFLNKYLADDSFTQKLLTRQREIDSVLKIYIQKHIIKEDIRSKMINLLFFKILKLTEIRGRIKQLTEHKPDYDQEVPILKSILSKAKKEVEGWNGKLYFVYLPSYNCYSDENEKKYHEIVIKASEEDGIPVIDIQKEVFDIQADPFSLFPFRLPDHYNAKGYKLVAEKIDERLEKDRL